MKKPVLHTSLKNPANHPSQGAAKAVAKQIKANNPPAKTNKPKPKPSTGAKKVKTTKVPMKTSENKPARPIKQTVVNHNYNFRDGGTVHHGSGATSPMKDRSTQATKPTKPKSVIKAHTEYELRNAIKLIREWDSFTAPQMVVSRVIPNKNGGNKLGRSITRKRMTGPGAYKEKHLPPRKTDGIIESNVVPLITNNAKPKIKRPKPPGKPANDTNVKTPKPANDTLAWPKGLRPPENIKERKMDDELKKYIADLVKEGFSDDEIMHIMKLDEVLSKDDVIKAARSATSKESEVDKKLKKPVQSKSVSMEDKVRASILSGGKLKEQKDLYSVGSSRVESSQELHSNVMEALKTVNEFNKHK